MKSLRQKLIDSGNIKLIENGGLTNYGIYLYKRLKKETNFEHNKIMKIIKNCIISVFQLDRLDAYCAVIYDKSGISSEVSIVHDSDLKRKNIDVAYKIILSRYAKRFKKHNEFIFIIDEKGIVLQGV